MTDTITVQRMAASTRPATANDAQRTVELVISTARDVGDGVILSLDRMPAFGPAPVPVLLSHQNAAREMAGRITDLRIEAGELIGLAQFTDAPAADAGWQLARSGVAVSVGATFRPADLQPGPGGIDVAASWRLREVSLVPVGADPIARTRSAAPLPAPSTASTSMNDQTTQAVEAQDTATIKAERAQQKLELTIRRAAQQAGLSVDETQDIVDTHRGRTETEALTAVVRSLRLRTEAAAPVYAGHPARVNIEPRQSELEESLSRALSGKALDRPLVQTLRDAGYTGRSAADVVRAAFTGQRPESWLQRGFHSTSDAKDLLLSTGDRRLQERFSEPPRGILSLARIRELADFREASILDVGLVGAASKIEEGGEIPFKSLADSAGSYKPNRHGLGLAFTFEAMANDDLGGLDAVLLEASATMLEAEANALVALLTTGANGANAPDGQALFVAGHNNSHAAAMTIDGLGAAVRKLREQTSIGGRRLYLNPATVLVGPELETKAAQLLTETWAANTATEANPWRLNMVVEPSLTGQTWYLFADGPRRAFELGRVSGGPRMLQEEDFSTSGMRMKVEHSFGVAVADHRVIVRCTQPQG
ncbi:MAG: hypothetical protein RLZZ32_973 [Cyanobacteriota bacterium]|jgi:hypothetical protein